MLDKSWIVAKKASQRRAVCSDPNYALQSGIIGVKLGAFLEYRNLHRQTLPACLITVRGVTVPGQADKCLVLVSNLLFAGLVTM